MTETKPTRTAGRGRIFPKQWTLEQKAQWRTEREEFRKRCQVIFDKVRRKNIYKFISVLRSYLIVYLNLTEEYLFT